MVSDDIDIPITIRRFHPRQMLYTKDGKRQYPFTILIGPRRSGKSHLLKDIVYHHRSAYAFIVYSETEDGNSHFNGIVPDAFLRRQADEVLLARDVYEQKQQVKENGTEHATELVLVFEDCSFNEKFYSSPIMKFLAMNGRNFKISVYATIQYINSIKPFLKENADYVAVFDLESRRSRDVVYEYWFNAFSSKAIFAGHLFQNTQDHQVFIYEKGSRALSGTNEYCFYYYKARKNLPPFVVGSLDYWRVGLQIERQRGHSKKRETLASFMGRMISTQGKKTKTFESFTGGKKNRRRGIGQRISII